MGLWRQDMGGLALNGETSYLLYLGYIIDRFTMANEEESHCERKNKMA